MNVKMMRIDLLEPSHYNFRKDLQHGDPEYEKLKRSIEEFGYVEPIIWNEKTGRVVGGHQCLKVMKDQGFENVQVGISGVEGKSSENRGV
ncbi:ParB N-terminal domain-containing protein [Kroppenstedtia pulmonis]|uniref:ParB N-terminal domain-containing protein n=1 Tax=Kroppenstedtia pulmonis TaxID=1380685 RepID=A0A7D3XMP1_9BACL|nr:ParB N-terminal domain-containing protein [Kroppenstedtia pulmonis]